MRHSAIKGWMLGVALAWGASLQAEIINPVVKQDGKEYYRYKVEKSEGFYALYRKFGATEKDIKALNPETQNGLHEGQIVLVAKPKPKEILTFVDHTVLKKQTAYSIAKSYDLPLDSLYHYNPEARKSLKEGMTLRIPVWTPEEKASTATKTNTTATTPITAVAAGTRKAVNAPMDGSYYLVKAGETLYAIAKKFQMAVEELLALNPFIQDNVISENELLRVRPGAQTAGTGNAATENTLLQLSTPTGRHETIRMAFLLPLQLDKDEPDAATKKFYEFYQGALIAVDSLKRQGVSLDLFVYDTDRTEAGIQKVLQKPELRSVDFIIGPAYTTQLRSVSDFARENKVRLIVPFSQNAEQTYVNPYLFQCNIGQTGVLEDEIVNRMALDFKDKNVILLTFGNGNAMTALGERISARLQSVGGTVRTVGWAAGKVKDLDNLMTDERENVLVVLNKNQAELSNVIPTLNGISHKFSILGWAEWLQMSKTLEETLTQSYRFYYYTQFHADYNDDNVKAFLRKYVAAFGSDMSKTVPHYNLMGFDITYYFTEALLHEEEDPFFFNRPVRMLQTVFQFSPIREEGGKINHRILLIRQGGQAR